MEQWKGVLGLEIGGPCSMKKNWEFSNIEKSEWMH